VRSNARTRTNRLWAAGGAGFSSATDNWATPPDVFAALDAEFLFTLDACASAGNAKCGRFFTAADDGLTQSWAPATTWMNPPYGRGIREWMAKAADEAEQGATVVCLVPARTDTKWWHEHVMARASEVRFVRGRLKFGAGLAPAPFPSALVVYRPVHAALVVDVWETPADQARAAQRLNRASQTTRTP
jgi:phage N-6-adenine-methyltransferase